MKLPDFTYPKHTPTSVHAIMDEQVRVWDHLRDINRRLNQNRRNILARDRIDITKRLREAEQTALGYTRELSRLLKDRTRGWSDSYWRAFKAKRRTRTATKPPRSTRTKAKAANQGRSLTPDEIASYAALKGFAV